MTHEQCRDSRAAGVFTNGGTKPCWGNRAPDPSADNDVNNHRHDNRPDLHRAKAVEELRRDEPLLDHHIEELLDAINALQTRIGPAGASEPGV